MFYLKFQFSPSDIINIYMDDFINVLKRDAKVQIKIKDILDKYINLSYKYDSKIGYDTFFQNVILRETINLMGITLVVIYIEIKMNISRIKNLRSRFSIVQKNTVNEILFFFDRGRFYRWSTRRRHWKITM